MTPAESMQAVVAPSASNATPPREANQTVVSKQPATISPAENTRQAATKPQQQQALAVPATAENMRQAAPKPQQQALAVAAPTEDAPQAAPKTQQLALAVVPPAPVVVPPAATESPPDNSKRNQAKRQPDPSALPPFLIGHSNDDRYGGDIDEFTAKYEKIRKSGRKVVIDGTCFSACTIVASLPHDQVCVTPRASLGVHLATTGEDFDTKYTDWAVKKYYPQALQDWIKKHGGLEARPKWVKGEDLLTIFDACKKDGA